MAGKVPTPGTGRGLGSKGGSVARPTQGNQTSGNPGGASAPQPGNEGSSAFVPPRRTTGGRSRGPH